MFVDSSVRRLIFSFPSLVNIGEPVMNHIKEQARIQKLKMREERTNEICALRAKGYKVVRFTDYQFRIDDFIDIYPTSNKYHLLKLQTRGIIDMPLEKLILQFKA